MKSNFTYLVLLMSLAACSSSDNAPTGTFQFTGTVTGLNGTLVLEEMRTGKTLSIDENGSFTFKPELDPNDNYEIRILEEPCKQRCAIDKTSGNIGDETSLELSVSCGSKKWDAPNSTSDRIGFDTETEDPSVSINQYGDKIISWRETFGGFKRLYKSEYRNRKWVNATQSNYDSIGSYDATRQMSAVNDRGESYIAWIQSNGVDEQVYVAKNLENVWSYPLSITDSLSPAGFNVADANNDVVIKTNAKGQTVAAWVQYYQPGSTHVYYSRYLSNGWETPVIVSQNLDPNTTDTISDLALALNDNGDFILVWLMEHTTTNIRLYKAEVFDGTVLDQPSNNADIISRGESDAYSPRVVMDNDGKAFVVWFQDDADGFFAVFEADRDAGGNWNVPSSQADNISANGFDALYADISMNKKGDAVMSWRQDGGSFWKIMKREYISGSWSSNEQISPPDTNAYGPRVAMDNQGNAVVAWRQESTVGSDIFHILKSQKIDGVWTHPDSEFDQLSFGSNDATTLEVAMSECRASIVWLQLNNFGTAYLYEASYR